MLPEWAKTILTNEFEDDPYWEYGIESECPEAYYAISNIQRAPSDINQFVHARTVYDEYIGDIIDYYGGLENIRAYMDEYGQYPPGYCDPPKLTLSKKKNRGILKSGIIPQRVGVFNPIFSPEDLTEYTAPVFDIGQDLDNLRIEKVKGKMKKAMIKDMIKMSAKDRSDNRSIGSNRAVYGTWDIINRYYDMLKSSDENDESKITSMSYDDLAEMYDDELLENSNEWKEVKVDNHYSYEYGAFVMKDSKWETNVNFMKMLKDQGFNPLKVSSRKKSKLELKRLKSALGIATVSKKELKRQLQDYKEDQKFYKDLNKNEDSFRALSRALSRHSHGNSSDTDEDLLKDILRKR